MNTQTLQPPLTIEEIDRAELTAQDFVYLVGKKYRYKNGKTYQVTGFSWNADTDKWMVTHHEVLENGGLHIVPISRSIEGFLGGTPPRYTHIPE